MITKKISRTTSKSKTKKNVTRKSPSESASSLPLGTIAKGNDGLYWVGDKTEKGVQRWVHKNSSKLNGIELLSEEYLKKNIGKIVKLYCREYKLEWPAKKDLKKASVVTFIPTGNTKTRKEGKLIDIEGHINFKGTKDKADFTLSSLQMSTKNKNVSTNLMNTEVFIESK